jgi:hypothetical protein
VDGARTHWNNELNRGFLRTPLIATGLIKTSAETSFYLSNRPIDAAQAAAAIRKHWGIESAPQAHTRRRFNVMN